MLDRKDVIIAEHAQRRDKLGPPLIRVTVADRAENPGAVALIRVLLGVKHARLRQVGVVDLGVLGVYVVDGIAQNANRLDRIDALPEHVARVEVRADRWPGNLTKPKHRLRAVDYEPGVHLDGDLDAMIGGELAVLRP